MEVKYLIDANIFITAYKQNYPMDIFPSFWKQLLIKGKSKIILLDKVYDEILFGNDELVDWVKENKENFINIKSSEKEIVEAYRYMINEIQSGDRYTDNAKHEYFGVADSWICAAGKAKDLTIVTNEIKSNAKNRVKIPDVCERFHIKYINTINFIRELGIVL